MEYTTPLPVITVVTVVYNDVLHIEDTILSIINQTYPKLEYIVIDGGSTDGTVDVIRKYESRISYWVTESDKGIFDAMNKGLEKVTGEWVNFMNSGDHFVSTQILSSIFFNQDYSSYGVIWGYVKMSNSNDVLRYIPFFERNQRLCSMGICHQSIFVRRTEALKYKFDTDYHIAADYHMIYQLYKAGCLFYEFKGAISIYGIDDNSFSRNHVFEQLNEERKICNVSIWSFSYLKSYLHTLLVFLYRFIIK